MSRWSDLFASLGGLVTHGDTPRHIDRPDPSVCHVVSPCVTKGITTQISPAHPNGKLSPWPSSERYAEALTGGDTPRQIDKIVYLDFETRNIGGCDLELCGAWRYAG